MKMGQLSLYWYEHEIVQLVYNSSSSLGLFDIFKGLYSYVMVVCSRDPSEKRVRRGTNENISSFACDTLEGGAVKRQGRQMSVADTEWISWFMEISQSDRTKKD